MGVRGPVPLPANVHALRGNPSKIPAHKLADGIHPNTKLPRAPDHLLPAAKTEWRRIGRELVALGVVSEIDRAALSVYCQAWARWRQAEKKIAELGDDGIVETTPSGYQQMSAWLNVSNRSVDQMHKFMQEFGMTPSARSRVQPNPQLSLFEDDRENSDPAARYFT